MSASGRSTVLKLRSSRGRSGFTLVELMIAVCLIGVFAALALINFRVEVMRAKRTEALLGLQAVWVAQKAHEVIYGEYSMSFDLLDFGVEGGSRVSAQTYRGDRYVYQLSQPWGPNSFYCIATAQLDEDDWPDVLEIYELPK